jgi:RNA polymerase sigma factor (sigma-70 family)
MTSLALPERVVSDEERLLKRQGILDSVETFVSGLDDARVAGHELRAPQRLAIEGFRALIELTLEECDVRARIVAPMGSGKTNTAVLLSTMVPGRTVFIPYSVAQGEVIRDAYLAHNRSLIEDKRSSVGLCFGDSFEPDEDVVIAHLASQHKWLDAIDWKGVDLVLIDEADVNSLSDARSELVQRLAREYGIPIIGLSATEEQASGKRLNDVFPDEILRLAMPHSFPQLQEWELIPEVVKFHDVCFDISLRVDVEQLQRRKDLADDTVGEFMYSTNWNKMLLDHYEDNFYEEESGYLSGVVVFRQNIMAEDLVRQAAGRGIRAAVYTGEESPGEKERLRDDLAYGRIDLLAGSRSLEREFDVPEVAVVYNSLITFSPQKYWQTHGRVLRRDLRNPHKVAHLVNVLPRYYVDAHTGEPLPSEMQPLCHATFFDPEYYSPLVDESSSLRRGTLKPRPEVVTIDLGDVQEIRSSREVSEIVRRYFQKPDGFMGKPGLLARVLLAMNSEHMSYGSVRYLSKMLNVRLKQYVDSRMDDELEERLYSVLGPYSLDDELTLDEETKLRSDFVIGKDSPNPQLKGKSDQALARLIDAHKPIVLALAHQLASSVEDREDLVQFGLLEMVDIMRSGKFNPTRKARFAKYAILRVYRAMQRLKRDEHFSGFPFRIPADVGELLGRCRRAFENFGKNEELTSELIAGRFDISLAKARFILRLMFFDTVDDFEFDIPDREYSLMSVVMYDELVKKLEMVLDTLTFREREIVKLRYGVGDGFSFLFEEVGRIFKVTRERVRQIESKSVRKLQHPFRASMLEGFLDSP